MGYFLHILVSDPWIGVTNSVPDLRPAAEHLARMANGAAAHMLVRVSWHLPMHLPLMTPVIRALASEIPNLRFTIMAQTPEDDALCRRSGLASLWCNPNAFLDEEIYTPELEAPKLYDAVYVARLVPFKRHELAAQVPRLAVLTGAYEVEDEYARACLAAYRDLRYVNYEPDVGVRMLAPRGVRDVLVAARCGLALSDVEGAMSAATEYLLCGLPVVTTPSLGGREAFFEPSYVETVTAAPAAVAAGVARVLARDIDPLAIRHRTLELMRPHRIRLLMWLSGIVQHNLFAQAGERLWLASYANKLQTWRTG